MGIISKVTFVQLFQMFYELLKYITQIWSKQNSSRIPTPLSESEGTKRKNEFEV